METLIQGLVDRTLAFLVPKAGNATPTQQRLGDLRQNAAALVRLSKYHLDPVIKGLLHLYSTVSKNDSVARLTNSKIIAFQLFSRTLSAAIGNKKLDLAFDDDFLNEDDVLFDDKEEKQEKEEKEKNAREAKRLAQAAALAIDTTGGASTSDSSSPLPSGDGSDRPEDAINLVLPPEDLSKIPHLDDILAETLLKYVMETLFDKTNTNQRIQRLAARVLFKVSVVSYDAVFSKVDRAFRAMKNDDATDPTLFKMIEYMNFTKDNLSRLISLLVDVAPKFKKNAYAALAVPLRSAIWHWITNFPSQFVAMSKSKIPLPGGPDRLFDIIDEWISNKDKKARQAQLWPVQTMLLLLCPDILSAVVMSIKQNADTKSKDSKNRRLKFMESMLSCLKAKEKSKEKAVMDAAVLCFVDIYKASTFVSKNDLMALRFLIPEVQNHLQERLMNADNPIRAADGSVDVNLFVDFLVSFFRINQRNVTSYVFPMCFRGQPVYKLVMTKAMLQLAQESLPWHPTLSVSYAFLAKPVRLLFQDLLQEERNTDAAGGDSPAAAKKSTKKTNDNAQASYYTMETLLTMLGIFYTDPRIVLENSTNVLDVVHLFNGLCTCLGDINNAQIQHQTYRLLIKLFELSNIESWVERDLAGGFIEISSSVLTHFACMLVADKDLQGEHTKTLLDLMRELIISSNKFISIYRDKFTGDHAKNKRRIQALDNTEAALLVLLCSNEPEIWATAASCFGDLCDQIDILEGLETKANSIFTNYNLYRQLSAVEELGRGRAAQQKKIRKLLRRVELQTKANWAAFVEVYTRWQNYTTVMNSPTPVGVDPERRQRALSLKIDESEEMTRMKNTWRNYTAFLCALGGVCLQTTDGLVAAGYQQENTTLTDDLIKDLMKLVTSDVTYVRELVTATIGSDLSPALYEILFQNLHKKVSAFFGSEGQLIITDESTLFVEQAIAIVKSIIEQPQEESSDDLSLADFETLILSFVQYCSHLVLGPDSQRIKCKLSILIEKLMSMREYISFRNEVRFRFEVLEKITEWTSDFQKSSKLVGNESSTATPAEEDSSSNNSGQSLMMRAGVTPKPVSLFKELDYLCIRAISVLLFNLPLDAAGADASKKDEIKQREFYKYFSFLNRFLVKCKSESETHQQLREYTINALGNLLHSNINIGLEHFMKMAYREEQETSAFLAVLTKIMKQGINIEGAEEGVQKDKYEKLLEVLVDHDMSIIFMVCNRVTISEQDELCQAFVRLLNDKKKAVALVESAITREVVSTTSPATLFRANSTASKMIGAFIKLVGNEYMHKTLDHLVRDLIQNPINFEIDPSKLRNPADVTGNLANLITKAQEFIDNVFLSINECPPVLRRVCKFLAETVERKFPADQASDPDALSPKHVSLAGLFFLRFLNPAIVAPHTFGIVDVLPGKDALRSLMMITKVLQNVANGVKIKKEEYMKPLDPFTLRNLSQMREFFDELAADVSDSDDGSTTGTSTSALVTDSDLASSSDNTLTEGGDVGISDEAKDDDLQTLHRYLYQYMEQMHQSAVTSQEKGALEQLLIVMGELGKPPEVKKKAVAAQSAGKEFTSIIFDEFMRRTENRDVSKIQQRELFYSKGTSKLGHPVLYYIARNFSEKDDIDLICYFILKTMQQVWTRFYDLVFDSTLWSEDSDVQIGWIVKFLKLVPPGARKNLRTVYILNPNGFFKNYSKTVKRFLTTKNSKKVVFVSSTKELSSHIDEKELAVPAKTVEMESNVSTTFAPVYQTIANQLKESTLKLSNKMLIIITNKENMLSQDARRVDFIPINLISDVSMAPASKNEVAEEVLIKYDFPVKTISFRTPLKDQLIMAIKASKARQAIDSRLAERVQGGANDRHNIRQSDIPGSLLNMCFLNLESRFPSTRAAAYNLLVALAEHFHFPIETSLMEAEALCVPHNTGDLVVEFSEHVASAQPNITLEFLREALRGLESVLPPYKYLCLKYMRPWIKNLSQIYRNIESTNDTEKLEMLKEWVHALTKATWKWPEIYAQFVHEIWTEVSKDGNLISIALDNILAMAIEGGVGSEKTDALNEMIATLGVHNANLLVRRLIRNILDVWDKEVRSLDDINSENHPGWNKIIVFSRFLLILSFHNRINVVENLPLLFHFITLIVGRGNTYLRSTIMSLCNNVVHSLASGFVLNKEQRKTIQNYLNLLTHPRFRLIFLGSTMITLDPFAKPQIKEKRKLEETTMWHIESLAQFFLEVMNTCYTADPALQRDWSKTWIALCRSVAANGNSFLLPRALVVLGVIARSNEAVDGLPFVLKTLVSCLHNFNMIDIDLPTACLLCLGQLCLKLPTTCEATSKLLVIPLMLLPASDNRLFPAVVHLFECVLKLLENSNAFKSCNSIEEYFNKYCREGEMEPMIERLEGTISLSFRTSFSYAVASLLMKGLTNSASKALTAQMLTTLVNVSGKVNTATPDLLGYISALMPFVTPEQFQVIMGEDKSLFVEENFSVHAESALLFVRYLLTVVQNIELENEQVVVYQVLHKAFTNLPHVFEPIYGHIMPRIIDVYNQSQNQKIAEVSLSLINTMISVSAEPLEQGRNPQMRSASEDKLSLRQLQFNGIDKIGSFKINTDTMKSECLKLALDFVRQAVASIGAAAAAESADSGTPQPISFDTPPSDEETLLPPSSLALSSHPSAFGSVSAMGQSLSAFNTATGSSLGSGQNLANASLLASKPRIHSTTLSYTSSAASPTTLSTSSSQYDSASSSSSATPVVKRVQF